MAAQGRKLATHSLWGKGEGFTIGDHMGLEVGMGVRSERREKKSFQAEKAHAESEISNSLVFSGKLRNSG